MRRGLSPSLTVLALFWMAGCGGDRRASSASAGDTSRITIRDTSPAPAQDSAARDTTAQKAQPESTAAPRDTARRVAARPAARRKPRPARPAAPAAPRPDTAADTIPAAPADTGAAASASADTTTASSHQASAPLRDQYHTAPLDTVAPQVYDGWKQYNLNCARCHGEDVLGTTIAPHLIVSLKPDGPINTKELFVQTVCAGRPEKGMPAWCPLGMEMPTIEGIYAYVKGRSEGKLRPGRPARAGG
jgi:hypothetical protein